MDRQAMDALHAGALGSPKRVFMRVLSETPLSREACSFIFEHRAKLDLGALIALFGAPLATDVALDEKPLVGRLAELAPGDVLAVLGLAQRISAPAWLEDLTLPLRGRLPEYLWYRFVDKARGGPLFNALNEGFRHPQIPTPDQMIVTSIEADRPPPLILPLLEFAHDDLAVAKWSLGNLPVLRLLELHARFPTLLPLEAIQRELPNRARSLGESWVSDNGEVALPVWMAPYVVERLHHCGDAEACRLYRWLFLLPEGSHNADPYELAVERFRHEPIQRFWHPLVGRHLSTGTHWKKRGAAFIDLCIDLGFGFPPLTLRAALEAAAEEHGASAEKHKLSILRKVHDVTSKLLVERADAALRRGDHAAGDRFLSAFTSLDPGSFIGGAVHHLRKLSGLPEGISARIMACEELVRAGGRDPSEEAFLEAFLVLTGQVQ